MNSNPRPEPGPDSDARPKSSRPLVWLAALALGGGAILGLLRSQPTPDATVSATPAAIQDATPQTRLGRDGTLKSSTMSPLSEGFSEPQLVIFVPDDNGEPRRRTLAPRGDIPKDPREAKEKLATQAIQALMQADPEMLPSGTALDSFSIEQDTPTLHFNAAFAEASFWQGETRTTSALDALALTVANTKNQIPGSDGDGIRIMVDGKPLQTLGELDLRDPYPPPASAPPAGETP